jgi:hypothetical protein
MLSPWLCRNDHNVLIKLRDLNLPLASLAATKTLKAGRREGERMGNDPPPSSQAEGQSAAKILKKRHLPGSMILKTTDVSRVRLIKM